MNTKYLRHYRASSELKCILILLGLTYIFLIPLIVLIYFFPVFELGSHSTYGEDYSFISLFFILIILAPLLETFIFQWIPIKFFRNKLKLSFTKTCLISAVIFSVNHYYNLGYIIVTFILGYIFVGGYMILQNTNKNAFRVVCMTHALRNLISTLAVVFLL